MASFEGFEGSMISHSESDAFSSTDLVLPADTKNVLAWLTSVVPERCGGPKVGNACALRQLGT